MNHSVPKLPQYRILGLIGEGQFGQVYCAVHRQSGELVAIKQLDRKALPSHQFIRELSFLLSLRHPNIVSCSGMQYQKNGRYLITDYCEGGTLRELMESGGELSLYYRLKLIIDVLQGLAYAHQQKVIHCDLKPENILLTPETEGWRARITDFGIARLQELDNTNIGRGYTGSPAYMAPERFYGKFSPHSDIYAVGIMLYEILTGKRPFSGLPGQLMIAHLNERVNFTESIPNVLQSIILKSLEKLPQRRYSSAEAMLKDLDRVLDHIKKPVSLPYLRSSPQTPTSSSQVKILHQTPLAFAVTKIAVYDRYIYLGLGNQLWCQIYPSNQFKSTPSQEWQIIFNHPISLLEIRPQGCLVLTKEKPYQNLYQIPFKYLSDYAVAQDFFIQSWQATKFTLTFDPKGRWLAMVYRPTEDKSSTAFQLLKLPDFALVKEPYPFSYPVYLVALDSHHGMTFNLYERKKEYQTRLKLFNRRGDIIPSLVLPFGLCKITPNYDLPYCLFAVELGHSFMGILLHLKPWKVTRIVLEIEIAFIVPHPQGFCVADTQGNIIILDDQGMRMGQSLLAIEGEVTAIALANQTQLIVTTWDQKQGKLYHLDITELMVNGEA